MALICVQCNLRRFVHGLSPIVYDESIDEHMKRCHPDDELTAKERRELEAQAQQILRDINDTLT